MNELLNTPRTMSSTGAMNGARWAMPIALLAYWVSGIRLLCPQWSVYPQYNYGWAVPLLCVYLLWLRWADRPPAEPERSHWPWAILIAAALAWLPTRVIVEANPIWRLGSWAMGLEFVALTLAGVWLAGGRPWLRHFWFPVAFYLVAIPWPSQWENTIVQELTRVNTALVVEWLAVLGIPSIKHGNLIEISRGLVSIDEACSGIRSLQATGMIALFFGELYRLRPGRRILLVVSGAAVALLCNMLRTFTLVWINSRHGNAVMEKWHDPTGVAILLGCFTSLWLIGTRLRRHAPPASARVSPPPLEIRPRWVAALLCGWLVIIECANAAWFGFRDPAQVGVRNWSVRWPVEKDKFRDVELSRSVRALMAFDEGRSAAWSDANGDLWQAFHFSWGPARNSFDRVRVHLAKTHRPEVCLPASGQELREHRGVKLFRVNGLALPFQLFRFEDRGMPLFVYFCAWEDGLKGGPSFMRENVASRIAAAKAGSRSLGQRVLEVAVWGRMTNEEVDQAFQRTLEEMIER